MNIRSISLLIVLGIMAGPLATRSSALDSTAPGMDPTHNTGFCEDPYIVTCKVITATLVGQTCSTAAGRCCATKMYDFTCSDGTKNTVTHYYAGSTTDVCLGFSCGSPYTNPPTGPGQPTGS